MSEESPVTRSLFRAFVSEVEGAIVAARPEARIDLAGMELMLARESDGTLTLRGPRRRQQTVFPWRTRRPKHYPADLPFVAGEFVTIDGSDGYSRVLWWAPEDQDALLEKLHRQSLRSGWVLAQDLFSPFGLLRVYERDRKTRGLQTSTWDGTVTLVDRERRPHKKRTPAKTTKRPRN